MLSGRMGSERKMIELNATSILSLLVALVAAFVAWFQKQSKDEVIGAFTEPTKATPSIIQALPIRSWTMSESTKRWITFGESETDKIDILRQVDENEKLGQVAYTIHYSKGFYLIEYGLIKSSGREK